MMAFRELARYWHTLRHLRPVQFYGRLWFKLIRPRPNLRQAPPCRAVSGVWTLPARRAASLLGPGRCCFLAEERDISELSVWNAPGCEKLWLYNLHYFDDLNAMDTGKRVGWQRALVSRWVAENPPGKGVGFEPYPGSLRIVNWIKWALAGNDLEPLWLHSLAVQARWLNKRLEYHLLGNHLFANAKALVFAGLFFDGKEALGWLEQGMAILSREIPEQILADGGQFERSPLYHAIALEDMLDLINLAEAYSGAIPGHWRNMVSSWPETIRRMRGWLAALCHPDGEIAFFNDAAIGIAPSPTELDAYAVRLGLPTLQKTIEGMTHLGNSGYIRVQRNTLIALLDVASVGPDYLPGHAHADTLSFELSLFGQRVLVNSGTSRYGTGPERLWQRGTAAHNTVTIDGQDSSEVWGGFRVARRARPFGLQIEDNRIICCHDGYKRLPGKPIHQREWRFLENALEIKDNIEGEFGEAIGRLYFHPDIAIRADARQARLADGRILSWEVEGASCRLVGSEYFPQFGINESNQCLEMRFSGPSCLIRLTWN